MGQSVCLKSMSWAIIMQGYTHSYPATGKRTLMLDVKS